MVSIKDLSYSHPNKDLLFKNINLTVSKHEKTALIGNNGSGKSTLLKIIAGIIQPSLGFVYTASRPYYLPQLFGQFNDYTISQALGVDTRLKALDQILNGDASDKNLKLLNNDWTIAERCFQALSYWHLDWLDLKQKMSTLSGGEQTKVFLSGIAIYQPEIILLDEPSNGLDPIGIISLRDLLKQLRDSGTAIVVSSHRLGELEKLTSDYIFLYRGQVVSFGDRIASNRAGHLRVELASNGNYIAEKLLLSSKILSASDTELVIAVIDAEDVPNIVSELVKGGARITSVILQRENIEDVFLRLYNERT